MYRVCAACGAALDPGERCDCGSNSFTMPTSKSFATTHTPAELKKLSAAVQGRAVLAQLREDLKKA